MLTAISGCGYCPCWGEARQRCATASSALKHAVPSNAKCVFHAEPGMSKLLSCQSLKVKTIMQPPQISLSSFFTSSWENISVLVFGSK